MEKTGLTSTKYRSDSEIKSYETGKVCYNKSITMRKGKTMSDKRPLVSICIPVYNNADYIGETIDSILAQTYENIELIMVDDNSTDDSYRVLQDYAGRDQRVKIYKNESNLGMSGNWNRCLELCTGEIMKLVCADDLLSPHIIERELEVFENHPEVVLVDSDTRLVTLDGKYRGWYRRYPSSGVVDGATIARKGFFSQNYFGAPQANSFRRSAYEKVGGISPEFHYIVDYDFFVNIAKLGKVFIIHEPLNFFRVRGDSNTGQVMGGDKEKTEIYVDEHYRLFKKNQEDLNLSEADIKRAVAMRKLRCFLGGLYLKIFVH